MTRTTLTEAQVRPLAEAATAAGGGQYRVRIIDAGMGSCGYYPADTLEAAGRAKIVAAGTHIYLDHPSESEEYDRPERSVRDLAGVFTTAGTYDASSKALEGDIQVFGPYRELVHEMRDAVGMSIRAFARVEEGEVDGQTVPIVRELQSIESVDFVTHAGRGGKVLAVLESARGRVSDRAMARGVAEATVNDTRDALDNALRDAYGGEEQWVWIRDFDDTRVWFQHETPDSSALWQQTYSSDDGTVALTGQRIEVQVVTSYVPVETTFTTTTATEGATSPTHIPPVSPAGSITQESEEDTMPQTEQTLEEANGRVRTLESERDTEKARADKAERALAEANARTAAATRARGRVTEANADLPTATVDRIVAEATRSIPLTEARLLDEAVFDAATDAARNVEETYLAGLAEAGGAGRVTGFGAGTGSNTDTDVRQESDTARRLAFGRSEKKGA